MEINFGEGNSALQTLHLAESLPLTRPARILLVDDMEKSLQLLEAMLLPLGYEIIKARDGEEALENISQHNPDLILLDVMMPGMDGFELARELKENEETSSIPIVIITALNEVDNRMKALEAGADDFLTKPVEKVELKARIQSLLKVKAYNDYRWEHKQDLEDEITIKAVELRKVLLGIRKASLEIIFRLSRAAEYRDDDTGVHINRISDYAAVVAKKMGQKKSFIEAIKYASPMHDVGKIGIPDYILLKPAKLTPAEWEIMKTHTIIGKDILQGSDFDFIKLAEEIAYTHHEKWDGSGYPRGLKEEEIPLAGHITSIVDFFDALLSKRPYKEPFTLEDTLKLITESRGTHFSPEVVDAFFAAEEEILAIKEKFNN